MPEVVISNTSPIFYLHRLRRLDLLQKPYAAGPYFDGSIYV